MSNNQTAINQATDHPWNDWKADSGFFSEIGKYLASKNITFVDVVDRLIEKAKTGDNLDDLNGIIVSLHIMYAYIHCVHHSGSPIALFRSVT